MDKHTVLGLSDRYDTKSEWEVFADDASYRASDHAQASGLRQVENENDVEHIQLDIMELTRIQWAKDLVLID